MPPCNQSVDSVLTVVHTGLLACTACGIFPDQGSHLRPLHWQRRIPNHRTTREVRANVLVSFATVTHGSKRSLAFRSKCLFLVHVTQGCPSDCRFLHVLIPGAAFVWTDCFYGLGRSRVLQGPLALTLKLFL